MPRKAGPPGGAGHAIGQPTAERSLSFVSHLESTADGSRLPAGELHGVHGGKPLLVRYHLDRVRAAVQRGDLLQRPPDLWRYRELLPLVDHDRHRVSLGEGMTPLLHCPRLGARLGVNDLWIKDEGQLPTGSFKSRGMAVAVSMAKALGVAHLAVPTQGNAGGALAAYAARAGLGCTVFMPHDTPVVNQLEVALHGASAFLVDGLIHDCGALVRAGAERFGWFDLSTLREPYRLEGKKTMGLELAEQLGWQLPDAIFYPTGGGTGLIGMSKAFDELAALGWLEGDAARRPRWFSVQSSGCPPLALAFDRDLAHGAEVPEPHTSASGVRVPKALGDFLILDAVRRSGGRVLAAAEARIDEWMVLAARLEGIALCPESALCLGALEQSAAAGLVREHERVVLFNTGAAQKYVEVLQSLAPLPRLSSSNVDWSLVAPP
jgi:threonine synthase